MLVLKLLVLSLVGLNWQPHALVGALDNGLALTPPMGWLAWERYVCEVDCKKYPNECINDDLFREMAHRLHEDGYARLGYTYVNIDDCWSKRTRETDGPYRDHLLPDESRFDGSWKLARELHGMGLKLGIYGDCGTKTCQGYPGQLKYNSNLTGNYYEKDAKMFADWGIDSFKFDGCYMNVSQAATLCPPMGKALNQTGRPMLFSCSWPAYENDEHIKTDWDLVVERCNLWRAFGDIEDSWKSVLDTIDYFVREQDLVLKYHGPGHWFDADQLVIGDFGLSEDEEKAQMAIWCIWASPLYMSNDLRSISKQSSDILRNKYLIAVNQDPMGIFGLMVMEYASVQVFVKPIKPQRPNKGGCPSYAIVYLDRRTLGNRRWASFKLSKILENVHGKLAKLPQFSHWSGCVDRPGRFSVHDLFDGFKNISSLDMKSDNLELRVNPSGVRAVQLEQDVDY